MIPIRYHGYSKYPGSNIDQWLNSDKESGEWFTADHTGDTLSDSYRNRAGFLNAFYDVEKDAILNTTIRCTKEGAASNPNTPSGYYEVTRKIYLPSTAEIGAGPGYGEGSKFARFDGTVSTLAHLYGDATMREYWFRTPRIQYTSNVWVKGTGSESSANSVFANTTSGVRPVMNLSSTLKVSDSTDSDACYTIEWNNAPTTPSYFNVPTIYGGKNNTISWGASTDPDGDSVKYRLECAVNGGAYTTIYTGTNTSYTHFVELGTNTVTYRVYAVDSKDAVSAAVTSATKTVINNRSPIISGSDSNLGTLTDNVSVSYSISDADGDSVTVVESLDGKAFKTFTATLGSTYTCSLTGAEWLKVLNGTHTLTITATDNRGGSATRNYTFSRNVTTLSIVTDAMASTSMPTRLAFTVSGNIPTGAKYTVEVCNNGKDASPTWETATDYADGRAVYTFTNKSKTASTWGVRIRVTVNRNGASGDCYISGIGGNFE